MKNGEMTRIWKEAIITQLQILLSWHLSGEPDEELDNFFMQCNSAENQTGNLPDTNLRGLPLN
jgi:hypothetical protein